MTPRKRLISDADSLSVQTQHFILVRICTDVVIGKGVVGNHNITRAGVYARKPARFIGGVT
jgi:hypothetical protein